MSEPVSGSLGPGGDFAFEGMRRRVGSGSVKKPARISLVRATFEICRAICRVLRGEAHYARLSCELEGLTDCELRDLRIVRADIPHIAFEDAVRRADGAAGAPGSAGASAHVYGEFTISRSLAAAPPAWRRWNKRSSRYL